MEKEVWKDIPGYKGKYQVSNLGGIRNIIKNRILIKSRKKDGYISVRLGNKGYSVHRLVAMMFLENIMNDNVVMHIDNNPSNNNYLNLKWGSQTENMRQCYLQGRSNFQKNHPDKGKFGFENKKSKAVVQKDIYGNIINIYGGMLDAERKTGILATGISRVCLKQKKHAGGFKWEFYNK